MSREPLRRIIAGVDPDQPVSAVRTMDDIVDLDVADRQQQMVLLGAFAAPRAAARVDRHVRRAVVRWCCSAAASSDCALRSAPARAR